MFLAYAFGGTGSYSGASIASAHARLIHEKGLNLTHFDIVSVTHHTMHCTPDCVTLLLARSRPVC